MLRHLPSKWGRAARRKLRNDWILQNQSCWLIKENKSCAQGRGQQLFDCPPRPSQSKAITKFHCVYSSSNSYLIFLASCFSHLVVPEGDILVATRGSNSAIAFHSPNPADGWAGIQTTPPAFREHEKEKGGRKERRRLRSLVGGVGTGNSVVNVGSAKKRWKNMFIPCANYDGSFSVVSKPTTIHIFQLSRRCWNILNVCNSSSIMIFIIEVFQMALGLCGRFSLFAPLVVRACWGGVADAGRSSYRYAPPPYIQTSAAAKGAQGRSESHSKLSVRKNPEISESADFKISPFPYFPEFFGNSRKLWASLRIWELR